MPGREEEAEREAAQDDQRDEHERTSRPGEDGCERRRGCEAEDERAEWPGAVRDAAGGDVRRGLDRGRDEKDRADRHRAEPEIGETERRQHAQRPEEERTASTMNHAACSTRGSRNAWPSAESRCRSSGGSDGVVTAQPTSASEPTPTAPNVQPVPATDAIPPSTGPTSAPSTAAPNAWPISVPRLPGGDAETSQASAPVHVNALASPWTKRAVSSCHAASETPKTQCRAQPRSDRRSPSA